MRTSHLVLAVCIPLITLGCASTTVKKDPGLHDRGVRFYRPKPYLLLTPTQAAGDDQVSISLQYLPDYSEEYSIHVRAGIGANKSKIKLDNGWNLTGIDYDVDSKTSENINAAANLLDKASKIIPSSQNSTGEAVQVKATNVPLGYYESVLSPGPDGRKQLYGWRYVGFLPYAQCPVAMSGKGCADCQSEVMYGLVFENGVMTFKPMPATMHANNVRDPKNPNATGAQIAEVSGKLKDRAVAVLPAKLGTELKADNVGVTLGGGDNRTYLVTVTLTKAVYDQVLANQMQTSTELNLAAAKAVVAATLQPELTKLTNGDTSWKVAADLKAAK
ncbi:MAG: hypothetical protein ACOVT5_13920 [Armatimonadaceae bacterium]